VAIWLQKDELVAVNKDQQSHSHRQNNRRDPELNVRQDSAEGFRPAGALLVHGHPLFNHRINVTDDEKLRYRPHHPAVKRNLGAQKNALEMGLFGAGIWCTLAIT
jgi:hypothetical protein